MNYKFYIQQTDKDGAVIANTLKDLEKDFVGLHYLSCTGLESVGKPKNIYTEDYAEQSGVRTFHPSDVSKAMTFEKTSVELSLLFEKSGYRATYNAFRDFVLARRFYFWDTARHKKVWLFIEEAVEPEEDIIKGVPYIRAKFKCSNLWGIGKACSDNGTLV